MNLFARFNTSSQSKNQSSTDQENGSTTVYNKAEAKKIIDKIVNSFSSRSAAKIKEWRESIEEMEGMEPKRMKYHRLINELLLDNHLHSQIQTRKLGTLSKKGRITSAKTGELQEDKTQRLKRPWFRELIDEYLDTIFSGSAVGEIGEVINNEIQSINFFPKERIIPERKEILLEVYDREGLKYDDKKFDRFIIEIGKPENKGLMMKLAYLIIWKTNAMKAWADFIQIFGLPMRIAKTNKSDDKSLDDMMTMLDQLGKAAKGVFPEGTTIETVENAKADAYNVFDKMVERANSEISKCINNVTMLSDNGSSKSQSEVHYKVNAQIIESDMIGFEYWFNFTAKPKLAPYLGLTDDDVFEFDRTESLGKAEQWKIVKGLLDKDNYEVPADFIEKQFGIPVTLKKKQPAPMSSKEKATNLIDMVVPNYPTDCCGHAVSNTLSQGEIAKILRVSGQDLFDDQLGGDIPKSLHLEVSKQLIEAFNQGFKNRLTSIEYDSPDHYKAAMYQANIFKFAAASSWSDVVNMNKLRMEAESKHDFLEKMIAYVGQRSSYFETEYNTSEAIAQNAANWIRQQEDAEDYDLQYQTVGDSEVRKSHKSLDGLTAPVNDKVWDRVYPPNAWNCRCEVIQVPKIDKAHDLSKIDRDAIQKGFEGNRGKSNFIFKSNHAYFEEFPEIKTLNRKNYGLDKWQDIDRSTLDEFELRITSHEDYERKLADMANQFDGKNFYIADHVGRSFRCNRERFLKKFRNKSDKEKRWSMTPYIFSVMEKPDEVWMYQENKKNTKYASKYIKNFKNHTMIVVAGSEEEGTLDLTTWYTADELTDNKLDNHRKGILIYKN